MVNIALKLPEKRREKTGRRPGAWLVPGETAWEVRASSGTGSGFPVLRTVEEIEGPAPGAVTLVVLPPQWVTCQLFWLETTDEKAVPDLLAMQCERRALLRQEEVWRHRIVRREAERLLAQVLVLQNELPAGIETEGDARFEPLPLCLELPQRSACLWRTLGTVMIALTDDAGVFYFQALPHRAMTPECRRDVQAVLWMAVAQQWIASLESLVLMGSWSREEVAAMALPGFEVRGCPAPLWMPPTEFLDLVPKSVRQLRTVRQRRRQIRLVTLAVAALYLLFLLFQIGVAATTSLSNRRLAAQFREMEPEMNRLQETARQLDALNPALDTGTYPLEILHRVMALLPESGVRLTRFEIISNHLEVAGESTTAREAFDFLHALQSAETLSHLTWEDPPQPVPLPNDTARFFIRGSIAGAYHEPTDEP
ncbi:MAG TPA: hypothetical protein VNQ90_09425 [Chthoniobacteraceae bacterium]|nr:hypothetical protein [Chthoniobacteraceae bacterium]